MPKWLLELEKKLDQFLTEGSHRRFQLFLTSDPSDSIPVGLLDRSFKVTNAPPSGLKANLLRAWCSFPKEQVDEAEAKAKGTLFGLCHFHAVMMERKMYGSLGFNMQYPFSLGDLRDSQVCLGNYMDKMMGSKVCLLYSFISIYLAGCIEYQLVDDAQNLSLTFLCRNLQVPWEDLRYLFGEIMYGGHIIDDYDRLVSNTYLEWFMRDELLDEMEMFPFMEGAKGMSFKCPAVTTYDRYIDHINTQLVQETPMAYGLHPNAEINFRTAQSESLFRTILELSPKAVEEGGAEGESTQDVAQNVLQEILDAFGDKSFDVLDVRRMLDEVGPFHNVFLQECAACNTLLAEISRSLRELNLGFAGELTMSDTMDELMQSLFFDRVPPSWSKLAWPSLRGLASWQSDFKDRLIQLDSWVNSPIDIANVTWLSGLINPQAFLTAIQQVTAQTNSWELDKLIIQTEATKMTAEDCTEASGEGAYISGFYLQGARWEDKTGMIDTSRPKEMFCAMPVIKCQAVSAESREKAGIYECPVYKTENRGATFVFCAQLKTKSQAARWVLGGVALIMDVPVI
jgi:dynein heavy chain